MQVGIIYEADDILAFMRSFCRSHVDFGIAELICYMPISVPPATDNIYWSSVLTMKYLAEQSAAFGSTNLWMTIQLTAAFRPAHDSDVRNHVASVVTIIWETRLYFELWCWSPLACLCLLENIYI